MADSCLMAAELYPGLQSAAKLLAERKLLTFVLVKFHLNFSDVPLWTDVNHPNAKNRTRKRAPSRSTELRPFSVVEKPSLRLIVRHSVPSFYDAMINIDFEDSQIQTVRDAVGNV